MPNALTTLLAFQPLDALQIANANELYDCTMSTQLVRHELSWYYFQRIVADGRIEVMSPCGFAFNVDATEICDVRPAMPIAVKAMPKSKYLALLARPFAERGTKAGSEFYADGHVLFARKGRHGSLNYRVRFLDEAHRHDTMAFSPIADQDRARLEKLTRRSTMPVQSSNRVPAAVADHGAGADDRKMRRSFSQFLRARLSTPAPAIHARHRPHYQARPLVPPKE
jgi:hypothetical protein